MIGRGAGGGDRGGDQRVADAAGRSGSRGRLLRECLRGGGCGKFAVGLITLRLASQVGVGQQDAAVVIDPAAFVAVAPRDFGSHPAGVEVELHRIGPEGVDTSDHAPVGGPGRRPGLDVAVVELHEGLRRDRLHRNDVVAGLRRAHPSHPRHGDAVGQPVVGEEDPLARLGVDLVFLEIGRSKELEVVEILIRQEGHPVTGMGRGDRCRQSEDRRQSGDESRNTLDTGGGSHRYVSWGAGAVCSAVADCSFGIGPAGGPN